MHFVPFHINRAKRSGRAEVLTGTAADAFVFVHGGHLYRAVWTFVVHHLDGTRGAVTGAVAAADAVGQHHAVLLDPHGMADMDGRFFLTGNGLDGTSRTDLAAPCAFGATVATLKRHRGLHEVHQVGGRTQDIVRTT